MAIRKLPLLLINQIAAGEVIERPASVVKELVENSLDAGATRVEIVIEDGGRRLVRISDDGRGVVPDELHLTVAPHATSKLTSPDQLATINTLGFRGEALASIASVSRLKITSRATTEGVVSEAGAFIEAGGDQVGDATPVACAPGTTVEVRDLFFNTPARRRFMRTAATEFGHISETVLRIAMVHSAVAFKLTHGSRTSIDVPPGQTRRQRCVALLGQELDEALLEFESFSPPVSPPATTSSEGLDDVGNSLANPGLWGLAGLPSIARSTSKFQYLCVNGRPIRDRTVSHAVKEAYRGLMPPDKQPVAVLFIDVDPSLVDVNVHPAKAEVRFHNTVRIHGLVLTTLRQRLLGSDLTPSANFRPPPSSPEASPVPEIDKKSFASDNNGRPGAAVEAGAAGTSSDGLDPSSFADYFRERAPNQKGFDFTEVKQTMEEGVHATDGMSSHQTPSGLPVPSESSPVTDPTNSNTAPAIHTPHESALNGPAVDESVLPPRNILQVHDSYLVTQDEEGLIIVDQHALHERVMFEHLRRRVLGENPGGDPGVPGDDSQPLRNLESQRLLVPAILKATPQRTALLDELKPLMTRIGIEIDPIGPDALAVHAFPSFLFDRRVDPVVFVEELLDAAQEGELSPLSSDEGATRDAPNATRTDAYVEEAVLHKVLDMMACKAAVKAGDHMSPEELNDLLAQRDEIERASSCPHGRPTTIRITLRDMAKQFKRT